MAWEGPCKLSMLEGIVDSCRLSSVAVVLACQFCLLVCHSVVFFCCVGFLGDIGRHRIFISVTSGSDSGEAGRDGTLDSFFINW